MRKLWFLGVGVWLLALPARVDAQFFDEKFDTYTAGSMIAGQGGWETWDNDPNVNAPVVNTQSFSPPNSLQIGGVSDIVHQFTGVTSGIWYAKARIRIPSTQTGEAFFILLNTYVSGQVNLDNWSAQVCFCRAGCTTPGAVAGMVTSLGGTEVTTVGTIPLILDQFVEIKAVINLNTNRYQLFYNNVQFYDQPWTITAPVRLQAMDLFSNNTSPTHYDNVWLDTTVPVTVMHFEVE